MPRGKQKSHVETYSGHTLITYTASSNVVSNTVDPTSISTRLTSLSDNYLLYRFVKLKYTPVLWGAASTANATLSMAFTPQLLTPTVTTELQMSELPRCVTQATHLNSGASVFPVTGMSQLKPLVLGKRDLLGQPLQWWRTRTGAGVDNQFEYQGNFYAYTGAAAGVFVCFVEWTIEFKDFAPPALTALPRPLPIQAPSEPASPVGSVLRSMDPDVEYVAIRRKKAEIERKQ